MKLFMKFREIHEFPRIYNLIVTSHVLPFSISKASKTPISKNQTDIAARSRPKRFKDQGNKVLDGQMCQENKQAYKTVSKNQQGNLY